jgi:pimeloyl-ACP methyl ester carboxylesterase
VIGVTRHFAMVDGRQVHYRRLGAGPPLVLTPDAPRSSKALLATAGRLSRSFSCLAIDPPGYGLSEPLATAAPEIEDYAEALAATIRMLVEGPCVLYGEGVGACVALEAARSAPTMFAAVVLRGLPMFSAAERAELGQHYTPPLEPTADGSHLVGHWFLQRGERLFWPWYRQTADARLDVDVSGEAAADDLNDAVLDQLGARPHYSLAYQASFRYDPAPALAETSVPVKAIAMHGDRLEGHLARLPDGIVAQRVAEVSEAFEALAAPTSSVVVQQPRSPGRAPGRQTKDYADTSFGQILVRRRAGVEGKRPLVLLHPSPVSAAVLEPLLEELAATRPVIALDTLGNGDSDRPAAEFPAEPWIGDFAPVVAEAIDSLELGEVDVYGAHTGAKIAVETALLLGDRVRNVILDAFGFFDDGTAQEIVANFQDFSPRWDGTHLLAVWARANDASLWFPWFRRDPAHARAGAPPAPDALAAYVLEFLKGGATYGASYLPAYTYPAEERLALLRHRTLLCAAHGDVNFSLLDRAATAVEDATVVRLPASLAESAAIFDRFLDGLPVQ